MNESFLPLVGEKQTKFEHEIDKMEVTCFVLESSDFTKYVIYLSHQLKDSLLKKKNLFSICSALWKTCAIFTSWWSNLCSSLYKEPHIYGTYMRSGWLDKKETFR